MCFAESSCNIILPPLQSSDNCDKLFSLVIDAPGQESLVKSDQNMNSFLSGFGVFAESGFNIILPPLQSSDNCDKLFSLVIDAPEQESVTEGEGSVQLTSLY